VCRNTREEVNLYTYRTPDYMLSTAQDYRKGYGGDQQHIWQATLGQDAVCFSTHPAKIEGVTPNYWAGSGLLPRAAQYKNVAIVIYNIEKIPALYVPTKHFFTHAWLPKDKFDEGTEKGGWIFVRKGHGYLALRSRNAYEWGTYRTETGDAQGYQKPFGSDREVLSNGAQNIWICQLGRKAEDGTFADFVVKICSAEIAFNGLHVRYQPPGLGAIQFGWDQPLLVDQAEVSLNNYPRYENAYSKMEFDADEIKIATGDHSLFLSWKTGERAVR
jgi:hypothetical protein